jgi:hypothetical protein
MTTTSQDNSATENCSYPYVLLPIDHEAAITPSRSSTHRHRGCTPHPAGDRGTNDATAAGAAAILTIFAEFILAHTSGVISVSSWRQSAIGVALQQIKAPGAHQASIDEMQSRLARVTDEAAISLKGDYVMIDAQIWTDGKAIVHG